jgi:hypothetical protein
MIHDFPFFHPKRAGTGKRDNNMETGKRDNNMEFFNLFLFGHLNFKLKKCMNIVLFSYSFLINVLKI